jgi:hypothetical protein
MMEKVRWSSKKYALCIALLSAYAHAYPSDANVPPATSAKVVTRPAEATSGDAAAAETAKAAFREGSQWVELSDWGAAIQAFEKSYAARQHALSLYNIGVCQRYLGRYTLARETLRQALARHATSGEMAVIFVEQANVYLQEIETKLVKVRLSVSPMDARVSVDGRALRKLDASYVAGLEAPGLGQPLEAAEVQVVTDPGPVVFLVTKEGQEPIELKRTLAPGSSDSVTVNLRDQPATLNLTSNVKDSIVRLNGVDVGVGALELHRPPGHYEVSLTREGYNDYRASVLLKPGQNMALDAKLTEYKAPITKRWWFWTAAGAALLGVGAATYFAVRPAPTRPPVDTGGLGWAAQVP